VDEMSESDEKKSKTEKASVIPIRTDDNRDTYLARVIF
jgi:hypothetical protein